MALLRAKSIRWLIELSKRPEVLYCFRNDRNDTTHVFLDTPSHATLHDLVDGDPLSMHAHIEIEPLLTTVEMAEALEKYLRKSVLSSKDWEDLRFPIKTIDPSKTYFLARKVVEPLSPLLSIADQDIIHYNTLISQSAHADPREIADFNPVAKPVGILIMEAAASDEVLAHVSNCQVYVDSTVHIERLLTPDQAEEQNTVMLSRYLVGGFAGTGGQGVDGV